LRDVLTYDVAHDSTMHFCSITQDNVVNSSKPEKGSKFTYNGSPILTGQFISETAYIGCGYDKSPILFKRDGSGKWAFDRFIDDGIKKVR